MAIPAEKYIQGSPQRLPAQDPDPLQDVATSQTSQPQDTIITETQDPAKPRGHQDTRPNPDQAQDEQLALQAEITGHPPKINPQIPEPYHLQNDTRQKTPEISQSPTRRQEEGRRERDHLPRSIMSKLSDFLKGSRA